MDKGKPREQQTSKSVWVKERSHKRNMDYYYNPATGESVWERPVGRNVIFVKLDTELHAEEPPEQPRLAFPAPAPKDIRAAYIAQSQHKDDAESVAAVWDFSLMSETYLRSGSSSIKPSVDRRNKACPPTRRKVARRNSNTSSTRISSTSTATAPSNSSVPDKKSAIFTKPFSYQDLNAALLKVTTTIPDVNINRRVPENGPIRQLQRHPSHTNGPSCTAINPVPDVNINRRVPENGPIRQLQRHPSHTSGPSCTAINPESKRQLHSQPDQRQATPDLLNKPRNSEPQKAKGAQRLNVPQCRPLPNNHTNNWLSEDIGVSEHNDRMNYKSRMIDKNRILYGNRIPGLNIRIPGGNAMNHNNKVTDVNNHNNKMNNQPERLHHRIDKPYNRKFHTPMTDRLNQKKEELIKKQKLKDNEPTKVINTEQKQMWPQLQVKQIPNGISLDQKHSIQHRLGWLSSKKNGLQNVTGNSNSTQPNNSTVKSNSNLMAQKRTFDDDEDEEESSDYKDGAKRSKFASERNQSDNGLNSTTQTNSSYLQPNRRKSYGSYTSDSKHGQNNNRSQRHSWPQPQDGQLNSRCFVTETSGTGHNLETPIPLAPQNEPKKFDLRDKLSRKRPPASATSQEAMEWEDSEAYLHENKVSEQNAEVAPPRYRTVYLVCDTCILLDDPEFVEKLLKFGHVSDLHVNVVIPYAAYSELDGMKVSEEEKGYKARRVNQIIRSYKCSKFLTQQDGQMHRKAELGQELLNNDDCILNCCLQIRSQCGEDQLAVLLTKDNSLINKASAFKLDSYDWTTFRKMARLCGKYNLPNNNHSTGGPVPKRIQVVTPSLQGKEGTLENEQMDIDLNEGDFRENVIKASTSPHVMNPSKSQDSKQICDESSTLPVPSSGGDSEFQSLLKRYRDELKLEFEEFIRELFNEAVTSLYGNLKEHAIIPSSSWTLGTYIREINKHWSLINGSTQTLAQREVFRNLVRIPPKYTEDYKWTKQDLEETFKVFDEFAQQLLDKYPVLTKKFLELLYEMKEEECYASKTTSYLQPVDVVLENISTYLNSTLDGLELEVNSGADSTGLSKRLRDTFWAARSLHDTIEKILKVEDVKSMDSKILGEFFKLIVNFTVDKKEELQLYELVPSNVEEYFQTSDRNNISEKLKLFKELKDRGCKLSLKHLSYQEKKNGNDTCILVVFSLPQSTITKLNLSFSNKTNLKGLHVLSVTNKVLLQKLLQLIDE